MRINHAARRDVVESQPANSNPHKDAIFAESPNQSGSQVAGRINRYMPL